MTEAEWLECADAGMLLSGLPRDVLSNRKVRLFRIACCEQFRHFLTIKEARDAVKIAEGYVEGLVRVEELLAAYRRGFVRFGSYINTRRLRKSIRDKEVEDRVAWVGYAIDTCAPVFNDLIPSPDSPPWPFLKKVPDSLVREIFGNPFHPVILNPSWLTSTALSLTNGIYAEKAFDRMPILADALQDAGCDNDDILNHCRQPGEHVRGCWCVDLILDKK